MEPVMARYISDNLRQLEWGTTSNSFDDMDIRLTRPSFGVVAQLVFDDELYNLRKGCEDFLLMRTRDNCLHMTVFQVFIMFHDDYRPNSLPVNLLECFYTFINKAIETDVVKLNKDLQTLSVITKDWLILGRDYPSHLVAEVSCKEVSDVLQNFKEKVNNIGYKWMTYLAEELKKRYFKGQIAPGEIGNRLSSDGWDLIVGYTANPDYKTHITMGLLPTNNRQLNEAILVVHDNVERNVALRFSSYLGRPDKSCIIKSLEYLHENYRIKELRALKDSEIDEFPTLKAQVRNAREGKAVQVSKSMIDEWGKVKIRSIYDKLEKRNVLINISRIKSSILNVAMIQNFEPIRFRENQISKESRQAIPGQPWIGDVKPELT